MKDFLRPVMFAASAVLAALWSGSLYAEHPCSSPLVFDLEGDGRVDTTGNTRLVEFDSNGDGIVECMTWAADGILWLDRNSNGIADGGHELFGNSTHLTSGKHAEHGFEALAEYDLFQLGGNQDGQITRDDSIWPLLGMWVDANLDAVMDSGESSSLDHYKIRAIDLAYEESDEIDGNANRLKFQGRFLMPTPNPLGGEVDRWLKVIDVFFLWVNSCEGR